MVHGIYIKNTETSEAAAGVEESMLHFHHMRAEQSLLFTGGQLLSCVLAAFGPCLVIQDTNVPHNKDGSKEALSICPSHLQQGGRLGPAVFLSLH